MVDLVDMIRGMLMEQRSERRLTTCGWRVELIPYVEGCVREVTTHKELFVIRQS